MPWLITTGAWPALASHVAGATARVVLDPVVAAGTTAFVVACTGALLLCLRARLCPGDPSA